MNKSTLTKAFSANSWSWIVHSSVRETHFKANKSAQNKISSLKAYVFDVL